MSDGERFDVSIINSRDGGACGASGLNRQQLGEFVAANAGYGSEITIAQSRGGFYNSDRPVEVET